MNEELATLVERARNEDLSIDGQHAAFTELVRRFDEAALHWALQRLGDPYEAKDATQDAFLTAWLRLRQLRDPQSFSAWLKRLVVTQCNRRHRKRRDPQLAREQELHVNPEIERRERQRLLASALARLPAAESRVVLLFYFLGRTLDEIANMLGIPRGTVGKRLHSARIGIRRNLPRTMRAEFLPLRPSQQFLSQVREGMFDEYLGEYRFDERPDLVLSIQREGSELVGYGGGQRSVLVSLRDQALVTTAFDGEGRFERDRAGHIVQFVYYEFGARLGVARKVAPG